MASDMRVRKTPESLELNITNKCNLRCSYCSHFTSAGDTDTDLSTEEWLRFFSELKDCAVKEVCLSGGEALIREDLREIITSIRDNRMRFSILSNGTLITDDLVDFIKSTGRCNSIQVSIDGPGPESHDVFRGKGTFERALAGLKVLTRHDMPATVRVTIHKFNYKELDKVAELLLEDIGLSSFSTNTAGYVGLCRTNKDTVQLNAQEYSYTIAKLFELNKKYNGRIQAQAGPLASGRHWLEMQQAFDSGQEGLSSCGYLRSCGGVFRKMSVRSDGVMVPCGQIPHIELGRINKDSLKEVWQNHPELKRLRDRRDTSLKDFEFCRDCKFIPYCRGGCPSLAYTLTGNDNNPAPDACYRTFLNAGGTLPKI